MFSCPAGQPDRPRTFRVIHSAYTVSRRVKPRAGESARGMSRRLREMLDSMSLRRKLLLSIVGLFVAVTIATSMATVVVVGKGLRDGLDESVLQLAHRSLRPAGERRSDPGDILFQRSGLLIESRNGVYTGYAYSEDSVQVALTARQILAVTEAATSRQRPASVDLGGDLGVFRVIAAVDRSNATVFRGLPENKTNDTITRLLGSVAAFGGMAVMLAVLGGSWLVRRNLQPLERVAGIAGRVSRTPLARGEVQITERVSPQDTDVRTEVGQVGAALNELLDHVDAALSARQRSETQLRRFVADASHELRTPLASIRGYAELSRREPEPVPETVRHALGRIDSESSRMASLVEDLLLLARLDAGRELDRERVDLTVLLIDSVSDARAAGPGHRWLLDLPEEPVETVGDPARLTQVVVNLLANARVHTPPGTSVTAGVRAVGNVAVVTVRDDGPGIPASLLPRIFSRFARGDEARSRADGAHGSATSSTGLGLSIVDAVVTAHQGSVRVESAVGLGTVFTVRLPLAVSNIE